MYPTLPLWLAIAFITGGLVALAWSSDAFVDGAAAVARWLGISPFIIGMVIIGFGTCAPEFFVSVFSGASGHASLSLGNAYGSCIFNIVGILGISSIIAPLVVRPMLTFVGAPLITLIAIISYLILRDNQLHLVDAWLLLGIFFVVMPFYCWLDQKFNGESETADESSPKEAPSRLKIAFNLIVGLLVMVGASHLLVWGSVSVARSAGVDELVIGLTIVAIGTSVPELAAAIASARKGESDLVLGNIVGSNLFNMLCVVGTAGALSGSDISGFSGYVINRDIPVMILVSILVGAFGINWRRPRENGVITRGEGIFWVVLFVAYMAVMVYQEISLHG